MTTTAGVAPTVNTTQGVAAVTGVTETADVTFSALLDGQSVTVAGRTITASGGDLTALQVAALAASGTSSGFGVVSGTLTGWTAGAPAGATVTFTSTTSNANVADITVSVSNAAAPVMPSLSITNGTTTGGGGQFSLTNMANNGTLELTGSINGASSVVMKNASGTSDVFNIKLNGSSNIANNAPLTVAGVETINIEATDSNTTADPTGSSVIRLNAAAATKLVVTGNHGVDLSSSTLTNVTELDASGVKSTLSTGAGTAAAVTFNSQVTNKNITVKTGNGNDTVTLYSLTDNTKGGVVDTGAGDDTVGGSVGSDTINLGDGNDWVWSSPKADTITLGAGKDTYALWLVTDSTIAAKDVITDFQANTVGNGTGGAPDASGAAALASRNGDVIDLSWATSLSGIQVGNFTNAVDAQTYIQNGALDANAYVNAALDATSGNLYLDVNDDGVIDSVIQLAGVTTLTTAAFVV